MFLSLHHDRINAFIHLSAKKSDKKATFAATYSLDNDFPMTGKRPLSIFLRTKINVETVTPPEIGLSRYLFFLIITEGCVKDHAYIKGLTHIREHGKLKPLNRLQR